MRSPRLQKHPLALSLQLGILLAPGLASAGQLVASGLQPVAVPAAGTYDTGTENDRAGTALLAEDRGEIDSTAAVIAKTGGERASGVHARDSGIIKLTHDPRVETAGAASAGVRAASFGKVTLVNGDVAVSGAGSDAFVAVTEPDGQGRDGQGIVVVQNSRASSAQGAVLRASGKDSQIIATQLTGTQTGGTAAAMIAEQGASVSLEGGSLESTAAAALLLADGASSKVVAKNFQAKATHRDANAVEASHGGWSICRRGPDWKVPVQGWSRRTPEAG